MSKLTTLSAAIERWVPDGSSVVTGVALEAMIPFAAGHELIRQGRRDLTLIGPISDILFDQLIGAGCVSRVMAAWIGNVSAGLGHNYRRAAERGIPIPLAIEEHSNLSIALGLLAGSLGSPYIPTRTLLGTDLLTSNPALRVEPSPLDGKPLVLVPAIIPDVAILQVQWADEDGHAIAWGNLGCAREALLAARHTIVLAEEIVDGSVTHGDPNRVLGPAWKVAAVVHCPGGAHPAPMQGHYNRDHAFFQEYHAATRTRDGWEIWRRTWIDERPDRSAYLAHLGERWPALLPRTARLSRPVDYGY